MSKKNRSLVASKVIPTIDPVAIEDGGTKSRQSSHYAGSATETRQSSYRAPPTSDQEKHIQQQQQQGKLAETDRCGVWGDTSGVQH